MGTTRNLHLKIRKKKLPMLTDIMLLGIAFLTVIPDGLSNISETAYKLCYVYGYYAALVGTGVLLLMTCRRHINFPKCLFTSALFLLGTFLVPIFHMSGLGNWFNSFSILLIILMLVVSQKNRLDRLMLIFLGVLEFWIYANFILMIIYPNGMYYLESNNSYYNWILGYKSSLQYYILPALCFGWINKEYRGKKFRFYILLAVSFYETVVARNMMLTVGICLFFIPLFFGLVNLKKLCNIKNYSIVVLLVNGITMFYLTWFISTDIGGLFFYAVGKNATLSKRASIIWPITFKYIQKNMIFGNGFLSSTARVKIYSGLKAAIHSHNQLLEIMFIGGIFLMILYVLMHISLGKRLSENKALSTSKILALAVFALNIMMVVEVFTRKVAAAIWLLLFLACMSKELHEQLINRNDYIQPSEKNMNDRSIFSLTIR